MRSPAREESDLADQLYIAAVERATTHGRRFKPSTIAGLKELASAAANEVIEPKLFGERSQAEAKLKLDERMDHAKAAVASLVDVMAGHAKNITGYAPDRLGERTLAFALYTSKFCPCWPFC